MPKKAARIKDISKFDNEFFGITKEVADYTDHQMRNLYEVVYESFLDAGINPAKVRGDKRCGIFFGFHTSETENEFVDKPHFRTTGYQAQLLTAVTNYFDIRGVAGSFDAACASSFAAFHQAVLNLKAGLVDTAIVCGVNISVRPGTAYQFLLLQMLSPTGSSKFLDAAADGYAKTEACVSVILQRQDIAKRSYAAIVHTKCNNDGFKIEGITYPSSQIQEALMQDAIIEAGVDPRQIVYVEAHGTGTPAGDPEEARAIAKVYCENRDEPLLIGSVKSNLGHAEGVSGLCSLAKVICTFENELLPKNLHYNKPNPNIQPLLEGRLKPVVDNIPFKHNLIPMNCYGFGGVNVHGIFKTHTRKINPAVDYDIAPEYPRLITMFGRSQPAIEYAFEEFKNKSAPRRLLTRDYLALLDSINEGPIDKLMTYRGYLLVDNNLNGIAQSIVQMHDPNLQQHLQPYVEDIKNDKIIDFTVKKFTHYQDMKRSLWFVLPGLGCQWKAMARNLTEFKPFWNTIESLAKSLAPFGVDLIDTLTNKTENVYEDNVVNLFTGIVAVQVALIDLLNLLGAKPAGIVGHSIGEISCAYADGLLNANETILLAYYMAKPIDEAKLHSGAMAAASLGFKKAEQYLQQFEERQRSKLGSAYKRSGVEIACINGDESVTLSGNQEAVEDLVNMLTEENIYTRRIADVKTAFHNSSLKSIEKELLQSVQKLFNNNHIQQKEGQFKSKNWYSTLYGQTSLPREKRQFEINAQYYVDNLCSPVQFREAMNNVSPDNTIILEVGPHGLFHPILKQKYLTKLNYVSLMKRMNSSVESILTGLGQLYQNGQSLKLANLYPKVQFPVAKGTGSVSSIIRWNYNQQFHVAKYPEAFRKPPCEARIKFDLIDETDKYLAGHCVDGRILFPATGYLYLVWRSFSLTKDKVGDSPIKATGETILVPVEFTNVRLYRATILGSAPVELLVRIEEATGQFEVREGGSVVADGFISQPKVNPDGLQYDHLKHLFKKTEMTLKTDDVYKQFRVCGYDYGESFRNIVAASSDGLHVQVKWTGQFIPFSDSVLQSLFLAICKKTSALFLPTKFEYMRINPKMLQDKVDQALAEDKPCILDAYCELETGIVVTDGIEMRGVGASPAPRRLQQDPVMESYQFVPNVELNISDILTESFNSKVEQYAEMCSTAAYKILSNLQQSKSQIVDVMNGFNVVDDVKLNKYLDENDQSENHILLQILDKILASQEEPEEKEVSRGGLEGEEGLKSGESAPEADKATASKEAPEDGERKETEKPAAVVKNGPTRERKSNPKLRSIQELKKQFEKVVKEEFEALQDKLGKDLLSSTFARERFLRPLLEIAFENTPSQKIKLLELNPGSGIKYDPISNITGEILPNLSINYFLGHPATNTIPSGDLPQDTKFYTWTPATKTLQRELQDIDVVVYSDSSCYPTKKDQFTSERVKNEEEVAASAQGTEGDKLILREDVTNIFETVYEALRPNGFLLTFLRVQLSPAERFLYKVADYELKQKEDRLELVLAAAKKAKLQLIGEKTDKSGCILLLFRKLDDKIKLEEQNFIHIEHGKHCSWLEPLKKLLNDIKDKSASDSINKNVWLLANDKYFNGVVGMVNCLRKEPGGERLRFILDQRPRSSFKLSHKEIEFEKIIKPEKEGEEEKRELLKSNSFIELSSIEQDSQLVNLIKQDLIYNCIDLDGRHGSFRHFTISELLENQKINTTSAHINVATRGDLSSFRWYEAPYKYEEESEYKKMINIYYSSLNFRDIMLASGRLPLDALPVSIALSDCILGLEFSGRTREGKRIAGMLGGRGIATEALYEEDQSISFEIPDTMSLEEGATIPVVYATVVMALQHRGRFAKGESILIHSGSGGVGQAAIRLCLYQGLTVYTTVGNQEKRDFLKEEFPQLTDAHIFNSRDCSFETDVMRATNGRGVDLVLNSLSEDKLQASVRCLADGGRFLEIGKYDMALNNPVELMLLDTNKTFHGILLDSLFDTQSLTAGYSKQRVELIHLIEKGLREGYIKPIKRTVFDKEQVEEAFRFMASGKHIGKVVIKIRDEEFDENDKTPDGQQLYKKVLPYPISMEAQPRAMFNPKLSYIITGGLGGFGLELSKWMSANGAKNLILTSRSGIKTGYQRLVVERLRENGAKVVVSSIDNSTDEGSRELIEEANKLAPIGGIFNLAMVLRDSLFENATVEDFEQVFNPKCLGVESLDRVTRQLCPDLELFVAFSSVSCGKGNAGQANYGYANSVMERICEQRRRDGFHGLAIQWGAIGDVGVAFDNLGGNEAVIGGTIPQRMPSCFTTLSKFLASPFSICLSILQADRRSFSAGKKGDLVKTILHVLGIKDPSTVDPNCTLGELGLDSLMAVEIRQALEREYDIVLTVQEIRALTINRIREIGDGETKKAAAGETQEKGLVSATDELGFTANQQASIYCTETGEPLYSVVQGVTITTSATGQRMFVVEKSLASKAPLVLPTYDLILLNGDTGIKLSGNPIFLLPPIQGDFSRMSVLTKKFTRPCIGICWTNNMAQFSNINDAASEHVRIIKKYYPQLKTLDMIGYSFGAAVAFEMMIQVQVQNSSQLSTTASQPQTTTNQLHTGKLVLLDGSPDQINIGVRYITNTLDSEDESVRAAEVMTVFLMQHSRFDYNDLKKRILQQSTNEQKLKYATDLLAKTIGYKEKQQVEDLSKAIEAYCRRFQIMVNYQTNPIKLESDVTLIRATEVYVGVKDSNTEEDYGLSKVSFWLNVIIVLTISFILLSSTSKTKPTSAISFII